MSDVDTQSAAVAAMAKHWPMIDALVGGTGAMREAGKAFLPQFPAEDPDSYKARLSMATLFPAFTRTSEVLAGKPFSKPVHVEGVPDDMEDMLDDIAGEGVTLHAFSAALFLECVQKGVAGVLVDVPPSPGARTKAEEAEAGIRPYFAVYKGPSILGWRADGDTITQLRLLEQVMEPDGLWGEKCVPQVRVLTPGKWEVYRKVKIEGGREEWRVYAEGTTSLSRVPFVPFYGIRKGFCIGATPLLDLAFLNVAHWQSSSDQQAILHTARVPLLFARGLGDASITVGAGSLIQSSSETAELKYVEHTGAAIDAGQKSIDALEDQMRQIGAELLVQRPNIATATQTLTETEGSRSILQRIVEGFEESLEECLELACEWLGRPAEVEVKLYKDFNATNLSDQSMATLISAYAKGIVSKQTVFEGLQRRDIVNPELSWDEEAKRIASMPEDGGKDEADGTVVDKEQKTAHVEGKEEQD